MVYHLIILSTFSFANLLVQSNSDTLRIENIPNVVQRAKQEALEDFGLSYPSYITPVFMLGTLLAPLSVFIIPIKIPEKRYHEIKFEDKIVKRKYENTYRNTTLTLRVMDTWPIQFFSYFLMFSLNTLPIA